MDANLFYENEYMKIYALEKNLFVQTIRRGMALDKLKAFIANHPQIKITSFNTLVSAINNAPKPMQKFAELLDEIDLETTEDHMYAYVVFNLPSGELKKDKLPALKKRVARLLKELNITYGIKADLFENELITGKRYVAAQGNPPLDGMDSVIKMYKLKKAKPEIDSSGKVDFQNMNLINIVKPGDWLGERIDATEGKAGMTIKGKTVPPKKGRTYPMVFDRKTIHEAFEEGKTVLYSKITGAVNYENAILNVSNHLELKGDVNHATGNINFDGYVSIKGTVNDGFSVEATRDIEINGELGVGNVGSIISKKGSIIIKGGIVSKVRSRVKAAQNVTLKYADNANIQAGGSVHIGYYSKDCDIEASEIVIESMGGQVIGGHLKARYSIKIPKAGSRIEKRTLLTITGFDRSEMEKTINQMLTSLNELKKAIADKKNTVKYYEELQTMDKSTVRKYSAALEDLFELRSKMSNVEESLRDIKKNLKTRGEGEIIISKRIYPNCRISLKSRSREITKEQLATRFVLIDQDISII